MMITPFFQRAWFRPLTEIIAPSDRWQPWWLLLVAAALGLIVTWLPVVTGWRLAAETTVFILAFIHPLFGLAAALLLGPLGAYENNLNPGLLLDGGQRMLLLTLVAWLARSLRDRRIILRQTPVTIAMLGFVFVASLSLWGASSYAFGLKELLKWIEMLLIIWLLVDMIPRRFGLSEREEGHENRLPTLFWITVGLALLAGLSQALLGIWQFGLRGDGPDHFLVLGRFYRAYGTFQQPNPYAGYLNLAALVALGLSLAGLGLIGKQIAAARSTERNNPQAPWGWTVAVLLCAVIILLGVFFSWSRGAWLALAAGGMVLILFWPRRLWQGAALLLLSVTLLFAGIQGGLVPTAVTARLSDFTADLRFGDVRGVDVNDANYAVIERLAHWQAAVDMAKQNVWLGVGFGNYEPEYAAVALLNWPYPLGHAHNYYLNLLAEVGVLGLGMYLIFWTTVFVQTIRLQRRLQGLPRGVALGLLGAWTSLTVHHLVDKLYVNNIYIQLGVLLALLPLLARQISLD